MRNPEFRLAFRVVKKKKMIKMLQNEKMGNKGEG